MTSDEGRKPEGAPERSAKAGVGAPSGVDGNGPKRCVDGNGPKRFSVQRKIAIVRRVAGSNLTKVGQSCEGPTPLVTDGYVPPSLNKLALPYATKSLWTAP